MTAPKEMTLLRRLSRAGGFIARHWKSVAIGAGAIVAAYLVWRWLL